MKKYDLLAVIIVVFFVSNLFAGGGVGITSSCINGVCSVEAASSLVSVITSIILLILLLRYSQISSSGVTTNPVRLRRRLAAFIIDFIVVIMITAPLASLVIILIESKYTGSFQWSFEREFSRPTDSLIILEIFVIFFLLFYYFYKHLHVNRQTAGQYILGYKIIKDPNETREPRYGRRVLYSFIGICIWPITLFQSFGNPKKIMWWDNSTFTRAVRVNEEYIE